MPICNICGKDFIKRPDEFLFRGSECFCQTKPKILPDTNVPSVEEPKRVIRMKPSVSVQNAMATTNTAQSIFIRIRMSKMKDKTF